ncbi:MAG TPA: hypothetical protein VF092_03460 [Longimicrobium sp.]
MRPTVLLSLACIAIAGSIADTSAEAQRVEMPDSGRVRITTSRWQARHFVGTVQQSTADSVMLRTADSLVAIPRDRVRRVEVPAGRRRHVVTGMMIGLVAGATGGALVAVAGCGPGSDCQNDFAAITTPVGAGVGTILGAGIGALVTGERWADFADHPAAVGITPAPSWRGMTVAVRVTTR